MLLFPLFACASVCYRYPFTEEDRPQREVVWEQPNTPPFDELILTWNAGRPNKGRFAFFVSVEQGGGWSPWLYYAEWGSPGQMLFQDAPPESIAVSHREKVKVQRGTATGFRIKTLASGGASLESVRSLTASTTLLSQVKTAPLPLGALEMIESGLLSTVPRQSQLSLGFPPQYEPSLPIAASLAVSALLHPSRIDPIDFARQAFDEESDFYGSWVLNCAESNGRLEGRYEAHVERLQDFEEIHACLLKGFPVLIGIRGSIPGGPRPFYMEHALCLIGYDAATQRVHCIDSAFPRAKATLVSYPLGPLLLAWSKQGNIALVFQVFKAKGG